MPRRHARLEEFTVGWICALPIELTAAIAALDEEYKCIPDLAQYSLGRIGQHGVAVICLPAGQLGTSAAAAAAVRMKSSFPALQYGLMVGIAGGVPSRTADIRLGDVVISQPQGHYGGVLQYDFGKTGPRGQHLPHGSLNSPNTTLLQAVGRLRASTLGGCDVSTSSLSLKLSELFTRPGADTDCLFEAFYDHVLGDTCDQCLRDKLVQRSSRTNGNIVIHYGTVASGNKVIKDGSTRDRISAEHGGVLCFEMEAAGLMNIFPCLIVRGICDYADSHKNKKWQPFAAAAAAVCAKAVLSFVPSSSRSIAGSWATRSDMLTTILPEEGSQMAAPERPTLSDASSRPAKKKVSDQSSLYLGSSLTAKDLASYHKSLRSGEIDARHATIHDAHSETCWWLLDRQEYQDWLADDKLSKHHGFFWIKGHPGTGKSTIMKFALKCAAREKANTTFIKFFFNARGSELEQTVLGMYRSLLFQLLDKLPDLQTVLALHCHKLEDDESPSAWHVDVVQNLFGHAIERLGVRPLTCFIDALDECGEDQIRSMVDFFEHLGDVAASSGINFRTCFSSRHYPNITIEHSMPLVLEVQREHREDIAKYVNNKLRGTGTLLEHVRRMICERSSGIFLWVILVVQILRKDFDRGRMHVVERRLQEIPNGTDELFNDIITRDNEDVEGLILCLQWILFARRPLEPIELFYGVTAGTDPDTIAKHDPLYVGEDVLHKFVLNSSKGLAELTSQPPQTVQFIHESVREYLLKAKHPSIFPAELATNFIGFSQERLKLCCEAYITAVVSQRHELSPKRHTGTLYQDFPLLEYAESSIFHHADVAAEYGLNQEEFVGSIVERYGHSTSTVRQEYSFVWGHKSFLYIFASEGLANLVKLEAGRVDNIDIVHEQFDFSEFPLNIAIALGHEKSVRALLERSNASGSATPYTSLYLSSVQREIAIKDALEADLKRDQTLISWAAEHGKVDLVKVLLDTKKVNPDAQDHSRRSIPPWGLPGLGRSPLVWAARNGHAEIVSLLLETGQVNVESKDDLGRTAFSSAARIGHVRVLKLMLEVANVDIESKCKEGRTPLSYAAGNEHEAIVELLLASEKVDIDSSDKYGSTPLSWAARKGHTRILKLLVGYCKMKRRDQGMIVDVGFNRQNSLGDTPLHEAVSANAIEAVEFLLSIPEVDLEATNDIAATALDIARRENYVDLIELLLRAQNDRAMKAVEQPR